MLGGWSELSPELLTADGVAHGTTMIGPWLSKMISPRGRMEIAAMNAIPARVSAGVTTHSDHPCQNAENATIPSTALIPNPAKRKTR